MQLARKLLISNAARYVHLSRYTFDVRNTRIVHTMECGIRPLFSNDHWKGKYLVADRGFHLALSVINRYESRRLIES